MENEILNNRQLKQDNNAQDFFLYLVAFLSLAFMSFGEGSVLFGFIDKFVTDNDLHSFASFNQGMVKFGIAALVIAGPIFFVVSRIIVGRINQKKIALESTVRKWLTYVVLFFAAATIIGDLIALVINFLSGDYAASFLLKVLVILLIAGGIFGYYFWDMRRTEISSKINKLAMLVCLAVVTITFIAGFFIIDSPTVSRQKNIDQQTIDNLQAIDSSIQNYFSQSYLLPNKLEDLQQTTFVSGIQNIKKVTYRVDNPTTYELCTVFMRSNMSDNETWGGPDWKHDAGNFCFTRIALKKADVPAPIGK